MSSSSETPKTQESNSPEQPNFQEPENPDQETQQDQRVEEEEDEEEGECGFCLFMKAGQCKDVFIEWENCVFEAEEKKEDIVDKCHKFTAALKECMEAHPDHYGPILNAEKAAQKEAMDEIEKSNVEEQAVIVVEKEGAKVES